MSVSTTQPAPTQNVSKRWPLCRGHWLYGCVPDIQKRPLEFYPRIHREQGDFVQIYLAPGYPYFMLTHPEAIEYVLEKNHKNYRKPDVVIGPTKLLMGNGIFASEGPFWLRQRRLIQPVFKPQNLALLGQRMTQAADDQVREWEKRDTERVVDINREMTRLTMRIASTSLFSTDISGEADELGQAIRLLFERVSYVMNRLMTLPLWVPTAKNRRVQQAKATVNRVVLDLIESRRRQGPGSGDLLDLLLAAQDEETGVGMTDQQLKDEVLTLLTAGHDTMAAGLSWAWYLLAQHPETQNELAEEARGLLQGRPPTLEDLPHLPLARAVFEETLRLYPPAWGVPRESIEPDEIQGYPLPAKAVIVLSQWVTHRHPDFWDEPECFKPERFFPENTVGRPKYAYFPFGGGPRICIGNTFALNEGPLILAALSQHFRVELAPDQEVIPDATFTLRPKEGPFVLLRRR